MADSLIPPELPRSDALMGAAQTLEDLLGFVELHTGYQRPGWEHIGEVVKFARWAAQNRHIARNV